MIFLVVLMSARAGHGQVDRHQGYLNREDVIKAAYLHNFARYLTWPEGMFPSDTSPFVIGVFGQDDILDDLRKIAGTQRVNGRPIAVRVFGHPDEVTPCHLLFIPRETAAEDYRGLYDRVGNTPTVLVGEVPGFANRGGVINFYAAQNRIRFEINPQAAAKRDIKISAKLLSIARVVTSDNQVPY